MHREKPPVPSIELREERVPNPIGTEDWLGTFNAPVDVHTFVASRIGEHVKRIFMRSTLHRGTPSTIMSHQARCTHRAFTVATLSSASLVKPLTTEGAVMTESHTSEVERHWFEARWAIRRGIPWSSAKPRVCQESSFEVVPTHSCFLVAPDSSGKIVNCYASKVTVDVPPSHAPSGHDKSFSLLSASDVVPIAPPAVPVATMLAGSSARLVSELQAPTTSSAAEVLHHAELALITTVPALVR